MYSSKISSARRPISRLGWFTVVSAIGNIRTIIYSLCMVVLLTVLLIAANSMAMMVRDRISEVAVMRALGFTRAHIAILLFAEAALIGLSGSMVGAGIALWVFGHGIRLGEITGMLGYLQVRPETAAAARIPTRSSAVCLQTRHRTRPRAR